MRRNKLRDTSETACHSKTNEPKGLWTVWGGRLPEQGKLRKLSQLSQVSKERKRNEVSEVSKLSIPSKRSKAST